MNTIMVVSPHPDDELLGCGGSLLKWGGQGARLHWVVVTTMGETYSSDRRQERDREIEIIASELGVAGVHKLGFVAGSLDHLPLGDVVGALGMVVSQVQPDTVLTPFAHDIHSDHRVSAMAVAACTKTFRHPFVRRVYAYETISETDAALPTGPAFQPNMFVDISDHLERKLELLETYRGEMGQFPFPRSVPAVRAWAMTRGASCAMEAAEAFMILKDLR